MDLELSDEQSELSATATRLLDDLAPLSVARAFLDGDGRASELWSAIDEGGWYSVGLEEDDPFGVTGLCLLARQCGAHAAPTLLVDTAVAARLAVTGDAAPSGSLRARVAGGELATALCVLEPTSAWTLYDPQTSAVAGDGAGDYTLNGHKLGVHHATNAEALLVLAASGDDLGAFFLDPHAPGVSIADPRGLDPSSAPCDVTFENVRVPSEDTLVGAQMREQIVEQLRLGAVATAAEGIGAASAALAMAVAYSLERKQFGRVIGSFQALQHLLADLYVQQESALASILYAAAAIDEGSADGAQAAAIAKAHGSRASRTVVEGALQVLGGIAFTWEHDVHLLQRRVLECERRFGDAELYERMLGAQLAAGTVVAAGE
jgi:alkylation response protein AidB-like acyl-CoA dehydrogenase